jgi:protein-S-isoprenylcysteine O-methyltransferase Ste14
LDTAWLWFEFYGIVWWYILLTVGFIIYTIYLAFRTYGEFDWASDNNKSLRTAVRESLYPKQQYFRIWDIVRTPFMLPGFILGFLFFMLKEGAWKFIPVLRKIFGIKLFKLGE